MQHSGGIDDRDKIGLRPKEEKGMGRCLYREGLSMSLFKVATHKLLAASNQHQWTNVYHIEALGPNDACSKGAAVAAIEKDLYTSDTVIFKVTAQPLVPGGTGATLGVTENGTRASDFGNLLPLFNTARITFTDTTLRPDQKYYRATLTEGDIAGGRLTSDYIIDVAGPVAVAIEAYAFIRSSNGDSYTGSFVNPPVQMRQVSWGRRTRPGFHRGYVAN